MSDSDLMNREWGTPPANKAFLTAPNVLAARLHSLIGQGFFLTGKARTDGANLRKLVARTLERFPLPAVAEAGSFSIVPPKGKGVPRMLREYVDTYIITTGTSYNLQVWNRNPVAESVQVEYATGDQLSAKEVRFILVRINPLSQRIASVFVLTPEYIANKFGQFGVETIKHQLIITHTARQAIHFAMPPVIFYTDTPDASKLTTSTYSLPQGSMHDQPTVGHIFAIEVLRDLLVPQLLGARLDAAATKNRGQALESLVARYLGYQPTQGELLAGGYPDIRNQALEVKVQDSPTVDLGQFSPQFRTDVPTCPGFTTEDIRYLIALTDAESGGVRGIVLCPGFHLGSHFSYVGEKSYKCQRSIPMAFFDRHDGKAVFNP